MIVHNDVSKGFIQIAIQVWFTMWYTICGLVSRSHPSRAVLWSCWCESVGIGTQTSKQPCLHGNKCTMWHTRCPGCTGHTLPPTHLSLGFFSTNNIRVCSTNRTLLTVNMVNTGMVPSPRYIKPTCNGQWSYQSRSGGVLNGMFCLTSFLVFTNCLTCLFAQV